MTSDELTHLYAQIQTLIQDRVGDIRTDLRSAIERVQKLQDHPALTVGDSAALIEIRRILADCEDRLQMIQRRKDHTP